MGVCLHHDGFVYDNYSFPLTQWGQTVAIEQLFKEEANGIDKFLTIPLSQEQKQRLERDKLRFRYVCCNQIVQLAVGSMGGCKKGKYSEGSVTLDEWEDTCDNNKEYQDKIFN